MTTEYTPDSGLTQQQVHDRHESGHVNSTPDRSGRSTLGIIKANVFTRINAMLGVLLGIVLFTGSWINAAFGLLIIANSSIGIIQELRAKRTLDNLSIVGEARPVVIRDGQEQEIHRSEIVLDDLIVIHSGTQILVDGEVRAATHLEVDESMLTGESDAVAKQPGDEVLSGSFVSSGHGTFQATKVGSDAYAASLTQAANRFELTESQLMTGINKILRIITWLLIPTGILTMYTALFRSGASLRDSILAMVAALVPMIPEGLVLMTSIAFAVGVVRLGKSKALVNELPAIEGLARVDVVCTDKTGTLTENRMVVQHVVAPADSSDHDHQPASAEALRGLAAVIDADDDPNDTARAIGEWLEENRPDGDDLGDVRDTMPFNSSRKWSGVRAGTTSWIMGAPDVLLDPSELESVAEFTDAGLRVLVIARTEQELDQISASDDDPGDSALQCEGFIVLEQKVRDDAEDTITYFKHEALKIKVISGDNAESVAAVARSVGIEPSDGRTDVLPVDTLDGDDAGDSATEHDRDSQQGDVDQESYLVDARTLPDPDSDPDGFDRAVAAGTVFGRVTPEQKRAMVASLQRNGHTVAMTGDGVNDVLALKDANIGVAMGAGSAASRSVAQLVLLSNTFATLPHVVAEGRRVIGNIERVANLFLTKTVYSVILALVIGIAGISYPFQPIHVTMTGWFTIGIPAFVLSLAPNSERARPGFVRRVLRLAAPAGIIIGTCTVGFWFAVLPAEGVTGPVRTQASTATLALMITIAMWVLIVVARPYKPWKILLLAVSGGSYLFLFLFPMTQEVLLLDSSNHSQMLSALGVAACGCALIEVLYWINRRLEARSQEQIQQQLVAEKRGALAS